MESGEKQARTIFLLSKQEEAVSDLYQTFSQKFPSLRKFWVDLAAAENNHAQNLRLLGKKIGEGGIFFSEDRFSIEAINTSLNQVYAFINEAKAPDFLLINALSMSRDLENSLLEKDYFQVFETDKAEVKEIFNKLRKETQEHRSKLEDKIVELQKNSH